MLKNITMGQYIPETQYCTGQIKDQNNLDHVFNVALLLQITYTVTL